MARTFIHKNRTIIFDNGIYTAYYSNYSANLTKDFKTLTGAINQINKWTA